MDDTAVNMTGIPVIVAYPRMYMEQRNHEHPWNYPSRKNGMCLGDCREY
jgi:hypothetical protein